MTLQDYTTDELKAELKRRQTEARKAANANRDRKHKFLYAEGTVTRVYRTKGGGNIPLSEWDFDVCLDDKYSTKYNLQGRKKTPSCSLNRARFTRKGTAPKEGDRVRLKCRITKFSPDWGLFYRPVIDEII